MLWRIDAAWGRVHKGWFLVWSTDPGGPHEKAEYLLEDFAEGLGTDVSSRVLKPATLEEYYYGADAAGNGCMDEADLPELRRYLALQLATPGSPLARAAAVANGQQSLF